MTIELSKLQYYLVPGESIAPEYAHVYQSTYLMWKQVWSQTLLELEGSGRVHSDDFSRQSMIGAVFHENTCIAMTVFHEVDFTLPTAKDDSYFKVWTEEAFQKLTSQGPRVLICSYLTIAKEWRKADLGGLPLIQAMGQLSTRYLLQTGCDVMTGTMRSDRNAHKAAYATGALPILPEQNMHGVTVDLVAFYRRHILEHPEVQNHVWTQKMWANRIEIPVIDQKQQSPQRKAG